MRQGEEYINSWVETVYHTSLRLYLDILLGVETGERWGGSESTIIVLSGSKVSRVLLSGILSE